ncbi:GNAT family N-acetyltransferase [Salinicoccus cyprini]|uniref:GNAT family N-acetyltransferase n=1 Tax=Salinicoccus cyprini TaxID=2493691 RepID=A0A558ATY5_9STAP|nr:GNAT family N-acetyltransferase [Salinicoccus cyprini]TVT27721.1 GNAT family N-acetyltransferase [Salinicoccus cyprini]
MSLYIKEVTSDFEDMEHLKKINDEAFPEEEHMPMEEMLEMVAENKLDISAVYDGDALVGFFAMVVHENIAFIFFLAVDENQRSKGYGSRTLSLIKEQYPDHQIVLDIESVDENADNLEQREARKQFYLKNGFNETNFNVAFKSMLMDVLCSSETLDEPNFRKLLSMMMENKKRTMRLMKKSK